MTAALFFSMLMAPVFAAPQMPFDRLGDTTYNTQVICSWIDGVEYGRATTSGTGYLEISTAGDDTAQNTEKIGGNAGDVIQYSVGDLTGATARFFAPAENDNFVTGSSFTGDLTADGADTILLKIDILASQSTVAGLPDYIVIYNPHTAAVNAGGYSLAVGTAAAQAIVAGDIPTGLATNNNINIPAAGSLVINMTKWGGLAAGGNAVKLISTTNTRVVDRVEYGSIATEPENTWMTNAAAPGSAQEIYRNAHADTNQCAADFATRAQSVVRDIVAPTITATTFADNAVGVSVAAGVYEATWSEAMAAVGSVTTNLPGATFSWPSTTVYRITYTALTGGTVYTTTYNGFTDLVGNAATGDLVKVFTTAGATATVTALAPVTPSNDNTPAITYTFANAPTSVELYRGTSAAMAGITLIGTDATVDGAYTVPAAIPDGTYYFAARGITGEAVPTASEFGPYVIDTARPTVVSVVPANLATGVAITANVVITFSEAIVTGTFAYTFTPNPGGLSVAWSAGNTVATISHTDFATGTSYQVSITTATDLALNTLNPTPYTWSFTTAAGPTATVTALAPVSPSNDNTPTITYTWTGTPTSVDLYRATVITGPYTLIGNDATVDGTYIVPAAIADGTYYFAAAALGAGGEGVPTTSEFGPYVIDTLNPTVAPTPADNAVDVPTATATYTLTFNEPMQAVGTLTTDNLPGGSWSWTTTTTYVKTGFTLADGTTYNVVLNGATFLDLAGNPVVQADVAFQFTTAIGGVIPPQVNNLMAYGHTPVAADCRLTWTEMAGATSYHVYRSLQVNGLGFNFAVVYATVPASGTGTVVWDDVGSYSTADSYAWVVRSVGSGENTTDRNNIAWKLVKTFRTGSGAIGPANNYFALPYKSSFATAQTLIADMRTYGSPTNSVTSLNRWNQDTSLWETRTAVGGTNFAVTPGAGYYAAINQPSVVYKIVGAYNSSVVLTFRQGTGAIGASNNYIAVPYHCSFLTSQTLIGNLRSAGTPTNAVTSLNRWNQDTSLWETRTAVGGTNYAITPGESYYVAINQPTVTWTPTVITPGP